MGAKLLTIGMATYDDFDGAYFSIQSIRLHHPEVLKDAELLVIDNHPGSPDAAALQRFQAQAGFRYVGYAAHSSTAIRNQVFRHAQGRFVLCIDSHVLFPPGVLRRLADYVDCRPQSLDLLQGPMLGDNLQVMATHFKAVWSDGMHGQWDMDERGRSADAEPFEIGMQGLGIFACRRAIWPGFNDRFNGFGGEEGYIHEKIRRAGGRALCLPFLRWLHRFERPGGAPYPVTWEDRIRNYLIAFSELNLDTKDLLNHFRGFVNPQVTDTVAYQVRRELESPFVDARFMD